MTVPTAVPLREPVAVPSGRAAIWDAERTFPAHRLHAGDRIWGETNCYVDLWIEILNAVGLDPTAALGFTLASDFEGDQWTFYKFPLGDLQELYGVDTQELNMWRSPSVQVLEQVARGRIVLIEVDSYYLPDTAGVAYRTDHTKTTIGVHAIDIPGKRLAYFHNAGAFALEGVDFDGVLRIDDPWSSKNPRLLPYTELVKLDRVQQLSEAELRERARRLAGAHWSRRPRENPFGRFRGRMEADIAWLRGEPLETFHLWAFGTLRQIGACFEMAGDFVSYLAGAPDVLATDGVGELAPAVVGFREIATEAKALQFKCARAVNAKKPLDVAPPLDAMAGRWDRAMACLGQSLGESFG